MESALGFRNVNCYILHKMQITGKLLHSHLFLKIINASERSKYLIPQTCTDYPNPKYLNIGYLDPKPKTLCIPIYPFISLSRDVVVGYLNPPGH